MEASDLTSQGTLFVSGTEPAGPSPLRLLLGTYQVGGARRTPLATSGLNSLRPPVAGPGGLPSPRARNSGLAELAQAAASRAQPGAATSAQPGSPGSPDAGGSRARRPCPGRAPGAHAATRRAPKPRAIREASMTVLALERTQSARAQQSRALWRTASSSTLRNIGEDRRPPSGSQPQRYHYTGGFRIAKDGSLRDTFATPSPLRHERPRRQRHSGAVRPRGLRRRFFVQPLSAPPTGFGVGGRGRGRSALRKPDDRAAVVAGIGQKSSPVLPRNQRCARLWKEALGVGRFVRGINITEIPSTEEIFNTSCLFFSSFELSICQRYGY